MNYNFNEAVELVKREAKGSISEHEKQFLEKNLRLWSEALDAAVDDADDQFDLQLDKLNRVRDEVAAGIRSTDEYNTALEFYEDWCKKVSRYRIGLDQRSREVRVLIRTEFANAFDHQDYGLALYEAIAAHRKQKCEVDELNGDSVDNELWQWLNDQVDTN